MPDKRLSPEEIERNRTMLLHLRTWFLFRDLTQEEIANRLGVSAGTLSKWLGGTQAMSVGQFTALAQLLKAEPSQLLLPPGETEQAAEYEDVSHILANLEPEAKAQWIGVGKAMTGDRPKKV